MIMITEVLLTTLTRTMKKISNAIFIVSSLFVLFVAISTTFAASHIAPQFFDVDPEVWYADAVYELREKGIFSGFPDGTFRPDTNVNRAELAVVLRAMLTYLENENGSVVLSVPFTAQAPHGNWNLPYKEACEEASIIMVAHYLNDEKLTQDRADEEILRLIHDETEYGFGVDIGVEETLELAQQSYGLQGEVFYDDDVRIEKIKSLLLDGHPIIVPVAGRILANPNYREPGPEYHMLVIVGFTDKGFVTHDPGTRSGALYEYPFSVMMRAIHDWTGDSATIESGRPAILVLEK